MCVCVCVCVYGTKVSLNKRLDPTMKGQEIIFSWYIYIYIMILATDRFASKIKDEEMKNVKLSIIDYLRGDL